MWMIGAPRLTTVNDTTIAWSEVGHGPPIVLLHGLADSHRSWRRIVPVLAKRFHVYLVDLPGHGLSARPEAPYTLRWYADTIAEWMDAVGVERAHFCGHSFGGGVAQWLLLEHRRRVDRLALVAPGGLGREVAAGLRLAALPILAPVLESSLFGLMTRFFLRWASRSFAFYPRREIEKLCRLNAAPNSGLAFRRTVAGCIGLGGQEVQTWQYLDKLVSLPPLALFWGDGDDIIPVSHAHDAARRLGNVMLKIYTGCGHSPQIEVPDRFGKDLLEFFERRIPTEAGRSRPPARRHELVRERLCPIGLQPALR
jgi:pimeloyl-ACP methyl ester carboxylesterase